jgi:two-component system, OmpR family, sensor histidine kinase KdpD
MSAPLLRETGLTMQNLDVPASSALSGNLARMREYGWAVAIVAATAGIAFMLRPYLQITDIAMLFLLAVVLVAYRHRRGPAVVASVLSIAVFDFGFVPPFYTLNVHDPAYLLTFAVMLGVALGMSQLTGRIREQAQEAEERERLAEAQYALSKDLAAKSMLAEQIATLSRHLSSAVGGETAVHLLEETEPLRWPTVGVFESVAVRVAAAWATERNQSAGWGTAHCAEAEVLVIPLRSPSRTMGVVIVKPETPDVLLPSATLGLLEALVSQAAVSFERAILAERHEQAQVEVESERLRTALLSSLSHDLRTPLGSIEGAASSLLQESGVLPERERREMAETILDESRRMTRLITNLLDMVRVETGALAVHKEWQPLEEALGVALLRLDERLAGRVVDARLPPTLPLVPIDELLIEQVFINLLENAAKHTPAGTPIRISAWENEGAMVVEVADEGPGVAAGEEELIFRKFHRGSGVDHDAPPGGSGLGLTICRGIIAAHGGRIWLERGDAKGAAFRFTLPFDGPPPRGMSEKAVAG